MLHHRAVLVVGMDLVLNQHRFYLHLRQKGVQFPDVIAGDACGANFPIPDGLLNSSVGGHIIGSRVMQEQDVDIADVQLVQTLVNGLSCVAVLIGIELGLHHDFLSRYVGGSDTLAYLLLVAVEGGSVDEAIAALQGRPHRVHAGAPVEGVGAQAHHRQIIPAGEFHYRGLSIAAVA